MILHMSNPMLNFAIDIFSQITSQTAIPLHWVSLLNCPFPFDCQAPFLNLSNTVNHLVHVIVGFFSSIIHFPPSITLCLIYCCPSRFKFPHIFLGHLLFTILFFLLLIQNLKYYPILCGQTFQSL